MDTLSSPPAPACSRVTAAAGAELLAQLPLPILKHVLHLPTDDASATSRYLKENGVSKLGHRLKICAALREMREHEQSWEAAVMLIQSPEPREPHLATPAPAEHTPMWLKQAASTLEAQRSAYRERSGGRPASEAASEAVVAMLESEVDGDVDDDGVILEMNLGSSPEAIAEALHSDLGTPARSLIRAFVAETPQTDEICPDSAASAASASATPSSGAGRRSLASSAERRPLMSSANRLNQQSSGGAAEKAHGSVEKARARRSPNSSRSRHRQRSRAATMHAPTAEQPHSPEGVPGGRGLPLGDGFVSGFVPLGDVSPAPSLKTAAADGHADAARRWGHALEAMVPPRLMPLVSPALRLATPLLSMGVDAGARAIGHVALLPRLSRLPLLPLEAATSAGRSAAALAWRATSLWLALVWCVAGGALQLLLSLARPWAPSWAPSPSGAIRMAERGFGALVGSVAGSS
jgi:hypothetical protein